jgi:hypothetical protein
VLGRSGAQAKVSADAGAASSDSNAAPTANLHSRQPGAPTRIPSAPRLARSR